MDSTLIAIRLVLDRLEIPLRTHTITERKCIQKAIYLSQRAGVDLGYRFGWYLMGPYSPEFSNDYYAAAREPDQEVERPHAHALTPAASEALAHLLPIMQPPATPDPPVQHNWLELIASLDYLISVSGLSRAEAEELLRTEKARLASCIPQALTALEGVGLLQL